MSRAGNDTQSVGQSVIQVIPCGGQARPNDQLYNVLQAHETDMCEQCQTKTQCMNACEDGVPHMHAEHIIAVTPHVSPVKCIVGFHVTQVQDDIMKQLRIPSAVKLVSSFNRPNIHYSVRMVTEEQSEPLLHIVALLKEGRRADADGAWPCSIIYALKKASTEEIAAGLTSKGRQYMMVRCLRCDWQRCTVCAISMNRASVLR